MDKITNSVATSNSVKAFNCIPYTYVPYNIGYSMDLSTSSTFVIKLNNFFEEYEYSQDLSTLKHYCHMLKQSYSPDSLFVNIRTFNGIKLSQQLDAANDNTCINLLIGSSNYQDYVSVFNIGGIIANKDIESFLPELTI